MMRIRLPIGRTLLFLGTFFLALLALLPLRLGIGWFGLDTKGLAAREVHGSLWRGTLKEAQLGGVGLGDLGAGLHFFPLVAGRARIALNRAEGQAGDGLSGAAVVTRTGFGVDDVTGRLMLTSGAFGRLPVGQLDLSDATARFEDGRCVEAAGLVRAAVAGDFGGVALPGGLSGSARCDAGALLIALASQSSMETVEIRLFADGRYTASALVRSTDTNIQPRMAAGGFVLTPQGYGMTVSGAF
jgi:general secretion pathway protein N